MNGEKVSRQFSLLLSKYTKALCSVSQILHSLSFEGSEGKTTVFMPFVFALMTCVLFRCVLQLSVGAVQSHGLQKPILSNRNFHGCLENLLYNDLSLLNLAKQKNHQVSMVVSNMCIYVVTI